MALKALQQRACDFTELHAFWLPKTYYEIERHKIKAKPITNSVVKMALLFLSNHTGRNISNPTS
jgi:hypothetical protein